MSRNPTCYLSAITHSESNNPTQSLCLIAHSCNQIRHGWVCDRAAVLYARQVYDLGHVTTNHRRGSIGGEREESEMLPAITTRSSAPRRARGLVREFAAITTKAIGTKAIPI